MSDIFFQFKEKLGKVKVDEIYMIKFGFFLYNVQKQLYCFGFIVVQYFVVEINVKCDLKIELIILGFFLIFDMFGGLLFYQFFWKNVVLCLFLIKRGWW